MAFDFSKKKKKKIQVETGNNIVFTFLGLNPTSSYLAYELSQIASLSKKRTDIIMVDEHTVEKVDITYGKFKKSDLGLSRAEVTAKRCSASFNIEIETLSKKNINSEDITSLYKGRIGYLPVIICTSPNYFMLEALRESLNKISDAVIIVTNEYDMHGELNFYYKKDGIFVTQNMDKCKESFSKITNKTCFLEMSKNIFLYLDDILCEREISTEKILFDVRSKTSLSKYIDDKDISLSIKDEEGIVVPIQEHILCIIVGIGGTGASIAYEVSHIASTSNKCIIPVFIDGDIVENKNLNRQRFVVEDLNRYKSSVTAKRCRDAYEVQIVDKNQYIESEEDIYKILKCFEGFMPVIIGCSDSLKLRHLVCEAIKKAHTIDGVGNEIIYIDAGNGEDYGQVNFTYIKDGIYITPDYFQTSPQSLEDVYAAKLVTQMSCDELMNSAPQTKGANMASAITAFSYLEDIIEGREIKNYMSYFNNANRRVESKKIKDLK